MFQAVMRTTGILRHRNLPQDMDFFVLQPRCHPYSVFMNLIYQPGKPIDVVRFAQDVILIYHYASNVPHLRTLRHLCIKVQLTQSTTMSSSAIQSGHSDRLRGLSEQFKKLNLNEASLPATGGNASIKKGSQMKLRPTEIHLSLSLDCRDPYRLLVKGKCASWAEGIIRPWLQGCDTSYPFYNIPHATP